jgi:hypothetical protein
VTVPAGAVRSLGRRQRASFLNFDFHAGDFAEFKRARPEDPVDRGKTDAVPPGSVHIQPFIGPHSAKLRQ